MKQILLIYNKQVEYYQVLSEQKNQQVANLTKDLKHNQANTKKTTKFLTDLQVRGGCISG